MAPPSCSAARYRSRRSPGAKRERFTRGARPLRPRSTRHLSAAQPGLFGAATGRGEAHTVRRALIYPLLDRAEAIGFAHLETALEFWRYRIDSSRRVLGNNLGDPADEIWALAKHRCNGISRTEVRDPLQPQQESP